MFLGLIISDGLGQQGYFHVLDVLNEGLFWVGGEDGEPGVVVLGVDGVGEGDLDGFY